MDDRKSIGLDPGARAVVGVIEAKDRSSWQLAVSIVARAGLDPVYESSLGWMEISVPREHQQSAVNLLKADPRFVGKRVLWWPEIG